MDADLGQARDQAGVLDREEALRDLDRHRDGQRHGDEEHAQRDALVAQHDVERAPVARHEAVEHRLDERREIHKQKTVIAPSARSPFWNQKSILLAALADQGFAVATGKLFNTTSRVHKLLFTCKKRVTSRADAYFDVATGRPSTILRAASANDRRLRVIGMNAGLHC